MREYPWHGNVRQLRNVVQRICVLCDRQEINRDIVEEALELGVQRQATVKNSEQHNLSDIWSTEEEAEDEIKQIIKALRETGYRKGEAAQKLGIDRSTLWRKMRKYGLLKQ